MMNTQLETRKCWLQQHAYCRHRSQIRHSVILC